MKFIEVDCLGRLGKTNIVERHCICQKCISLTLGKNIQFSLSAHPSIRLFITLYFRHKTEVPYKLLFVSQNLKYFLTYCLQTLQDDWTHSVDDPYSFRISGQGQRGCFLFSCRMPKFKVTITTSFAPDLLNYFCVQFALICLACMYCICILDYFYNLT